MKCGLDLLTESLSHLPRRSSYRDRKRACAVSRSSSAAAPAARCRNCLRWGSFIGVLLPDCLHCARANGRGCAMRAWIDRINDGPSGMPAVADEIEIELVVKQRAGYGRCGDKQERVTIRGRFHNRLCGDSGARAGSIFNATASACRQRGLWHVLLAAALGLAASHQTGTATAHASADSRAGKMAAAGRHAATSTTTRCRQTVRH